MVETPKSITTPFLLQKLWQRTFSLPSPTTFNFHFRTLGFQSVYLTILLPFLLSSPPKWLKANVDGALLQSSKAAIEILFPDMNGVFLKAVGTSFTHWDSTFIELQAMLTILIQSATKPAIYESDGLIIEGDNYSVVNYLKQTLQQTT